MTTLNWIIWAAAGAFIAFVLLNVVVALARIASAAERLADCAEAQNSYYGLRSEPGVYPDEWNVPTPKEEP